jgi:hypothetical protein
MIQYIINIYSVKIKDVSLIQWIENSFITFG